MSEKNPFGESSSTGEETSNQVRFKNAVCYIPFLAVVLFVFEKNKTEALKKHIAYGMILLFGYFVFSMVLSFLHLPLYGLLGFIYIVVSAYLGYMTYHGKDIDIEQFDQMEEHIKQNMK